MTDQPEPIRRSELPTIPPPEWEFHTWFPHPDGGGDMVPGQRQRGVLVRRRVSYSDWEPVRPDRWVDEPPADARAAVPAGQAPTTEQTALRDRIAEILTPFFANFSDEDAARVNAGEAATALAAALSAGVDRADALKRLDKAIAWYEQLGRIEVVASQVASDLRRVAAETRNTTEHACSNCEGIDPDTCLMNPDRPRANLFAQSDIDTPGCDCGHDGMGLRWHGDTCAWVVGLVAAAREVLATPEPAVGAQQPKEETQP